MVGAAGFEPATPSPPDLCATGLRYAPNRAAYIILPPPVKEPALEHHSVRCTHLRRGATQAGQTWQHDALLRVIENAPGGGKIGQRQAEFLGVAATEGRTACLRWQLRRRRGFGVQWRR
jgi:hypothetical protein